MLAILGIGLSGYYAALLAHKKGLKFHIYDEFIDENHPHIRHLNQLGIFLQRSINSAENYQELVVSPGISDDNKLLLALQNYCKELISEVEFAGRFLTKGQLVLAITGTNGKTTTTLLLAHILKEIVGEKSVVCCGNQAISFSQALLEQSNAKYIVLELSSFQLEKTISPFISIAAITNIAEDHLNRYKNFEHYAQTKRKIYSLAQISIKKQERAFSDNELIDLNPFFGLKHNRENLDLCLSFVRVLEQEFELIVPKGYQWREKLFKNFQEPKHRCECFFYTSSLVVIDDSKATNVTATISALNSFIKFNSVYLVLGGEDKNFSFDLLNEHLSKVTRIYIYGEVRERVIKELNFTGEIIVKENFYKLIEELINDIHLLSVDCVLLSPACSSLDSFSSYQQRGKEFQRLIKEGLT